MTRTTEARADRLQRRRWGVVDRRTLYWSMLQVNVALADLERVTWRPLKRRHPLLPWLTALTILVAFDVLVKLTTMVLDLL
jgi:hypothetical protein